MSDKPLRCKLRWHNWEWNRVWGRGGKWDYKFRTCTRCNGVHPDDHFQYDSMALEAESMLRIGKLPYWEREDAWYTGDGAI